MGVDNTEEPWMMEPPLDEFRQAELHPVTSDDSEDIPLPDPEQTRRGGM